MVFLSLSGSKSAENNAMFSTDEMPEDNFDDFLPISKAKAKQDGLCKKKKVVRKKYNAFFSFLFLPFLQPRR